jgi:hypothetical protein
VLYLARVSKKADQAEKDLTQVGLQLLACQTGSDWRVLDAMPWIQAPEAKAYSVGVLLMAEVDAQHQIAKLEDALPWVIQMLSTGGGSGQDPASVPVSDQPHQKEAASHFDPDATSPGTNPSPEFDHQVYEAEMAEIEQWRQTLTRQSQDLRQREAEIEARQEELQQWEIELRRGSSEH